MVEWIRAIPGPTFLLIFTLVWAFLSVILWVWLKYDGTNKLYIPEWASMNPYTIAYLRDGAEAVLHTAFFSLYDKGYLRLTGRNLQDYDIVRSVKDRKVMVNAIERALYAHCIYPRSMGDVLNDTILLSRLDDLMAPIQEDLIDEGLLKSTRQHMVAISKVIIIIGTLIVFGGIKWNLGVQNDRPVGFLTIMLIIYPIITIVLLRPQGLHTAAGKRLLSQLEDHYSWLQLLIGDGRSPVGINPAFVVAVFGPFGLSRVGPYSGVQHALMYEYVPEPAYDHYYDDDDDDIWDDDDDDGWHFGGGGSSGGGCGGGGGGFSFGCGGCG